MRVSLRELLAGVGIGLGTGVVAGFMVRRSRASTGLDSASVEPLDLARYRVTQKQEVEEISGLLPDERLTHHLRANLEGLGLWDARLDVTTIDGTVYLRGREPRPGQADAVVRTVQSLAPDAVVMDELKRGPA